MAMSQLWQAQSEDSDSHIPLLSEEHEDTQQYHSFAEPTGSAEELRFIVFGSNEAPVARACDIILRKRAESEARHRKGDVCGRKISLVKIIKKHRLASCLCFSRVQSTKDEIIAAYASLLFPGPHAFLLVTDSKETTWEERLNQITEVFGEEAEEYVMFLTIGTTKLNVNKDWKPYRLEDNDESVENLFREIDRMTQIKFFSQPLYKNAYLAWEREKRANMKEKDEQHAQKLNALTERLSITERELRKKMSDKDELHLKEVNKMLEREVEAENSQKKDQDALKRFMIGGFKNRPKYTPQTAQSCDDENSLIEQLEAETDLKTIFSSITKKLYKELETSRDSVNNWIEVLLAKQTNVEKDDELLKASEGESTMEAKLMEETLERKLPADLGKLAGDLESQDVPDELKEKMQLHGPEEIFTSPVLYEEVKDRPLEEKAEELKKNEESQTSESSKSGGFKLVRRNSLSVPPNMSEDHIKKEDSQASGSWES